MIYLQQKGILSFYVDLFPAVNKQKFIEVYARAISSGLPGKTSRIVKRLREYLPRIIPKVVVDDRSVQFEFGFDRRDSLSPHIDDLLEAGKKLLINMELIQRANGSYEITDLFFKRWIRQTWG